LLVALSRPITSRRAFFLGLAAGFVYFAGTLYWITRVMTVYGGLPMWVAVLVNLALISVQALYPAIFAVVVRRLTRAFGSTGLAGAPLVWVATELGRSYIFIGFPWVLLGYSQATVLPIAQAASLVGVYGISALVVTVSAAAAAIVTGRTASDRWRPLVATAVLLAAIGVWGERRAAAAAWTREGDPVRIGLVQGNVDQAQKWNVASAASIFNDYLAMTRQAIAQGATLVLWPESSTPFRFEDDPAGAERVRGIARQSHVSILLGSDEVVQGTPVRYYNSAFLVGDDGRTAGVYRKIHLVPFGEYVPFKRVFFFAAPLVEAVSDFSPGQEAVVLPVGAHRLSTSICYEIIYPALVRDFIVNGSELLTTITNDAWFGATSAPYQHFEQASMRAIEEGRYLVRSANTGISGIVDPYGHVLTETPIFERAVTVGEARFLKTQTVYSRVGDVFAYASVVASVAMLWLSRRRFRTTVAGRRGSGSGPEDKGRRATKLQ
jgi:apolipoprotein N-acyltransferase